MKPAGLLLVALFLCLSGCGVLPVSHDSNETIETVARPDSGSRNPHYPSNRAPLAPSPLVKLPIGSIEPRGWLRGQLEREASGMFGRLREISAFLKREGNAWLSPTGEGHSPWEELPYWLKGFGDLGQILDDGALKAEAGVWIEAILASQDASGWFGPRRNLEKHDIWPNMIALNCLQSFHEATGDQRVLPFMTRYFRFLHDMPREHLLPGSWQKIRGGDNLESIHWLYNRTGEAFLLELAAANHERTADWAGGIANWHGVNICQGFREPAEFWAQSQDPALLAATYGNYDRVMSLYGQVPGGMFGADENCRDGYAGPRQGAEACSMVEFMHSFEMLAKITGDPLWADRCEEVAFNSLPAAMTPDLKALHYLTAPNMVQCDGGNKAPALENKGCMLAFTPHRYRCCQHNVSHGWPYYAEELWLATADGGLCASLYAPSAVTALVGDGGTVTIEEATAYPFGETVRLTLSCDGEIRFPLYLRVPRWCRTARILVNGRDAGLTPDPLSYVRIERVWKEGDRIELALPMEVRVTRWGANGNSLSVSRGPLTYSLKIDERWEKRSGDEEWQNHEKADLKSTAAWPAWEVFPSTPWNYALVLDEEDPASSFEVVHRGGGAGGDAARGAEIGGTAVCQPFVPEGSAVTLRAAARRVPSWTMADGLVGPLPLSPVKTGADVETVTLVPMGCVRLRIAAFPVAAGTSR